MVSFAYFGKTPIGAFALVAACVTLGGCKGSNSPGSSKTENENDAAASQDSAMKEDSNASGGLTDGALGDSGAGTVLAYYVPGGLDRIRIVKTDVQRNVCFVVILAGPSSAPAGGGLIVPEGWELESAEARQPANACEPGFTGTPSGERSAMRVSGTVAWSGALPQRIEQINVTLDFAPHVETLSASNVAVQ